MVIDCPVDEMFRGKIPHRQRVKNSGSDSEPESFPRIIAGNYRFGAVQEP
jgi:hypothetical protein